MLADHLIGRQLKEFVLLEQIGRGGMATVYRAHQPSVHRDVAIKVIDLRNEDHDDSFLGRFAQEAELIARLEHIHILPVIDYGIVDGMAFLAMRLLKGGSLRDLLEKGPMPFDRAADLFKQIASGLTYAHSKGIIHRDLKPANILLDDAGNAYIMDFGLAKIIGSSLDMTENDRIIGTPHFMSPEQLRGDELTPQCDLYSLGVVLYRMMAGQLPFENSSSDLISSIYQNLEQTPPRPSQFNPEIPEAAERVILKALEKKPEDRFETADDMADALNVALGRGSSGSRPAITITSHAYVNKSLLKARYWLAAFALILLAAAGLFFVLGREPEIQPPTVQLGQTSTAADAIPSESEIKRAGRFLDEDGFIGIIACNQTSEYHATITREIVDFAKVYGIEARVYDANNDAYLQTTQIERARAEGARGLIVCSLDNALLDPPLKSAEAAGIRLVFLHGNIPSYGGVLLAGDNFQMGLKPGRYAGLLIAQELGGTADVVILDFPELEDVVRRADGLEAGMLEFAPDAHVIGRYRGGTREFAEESIRNLLDEGTTFDVILSINDAGSYGAIQALEAAGYEGDDVIIVSVDAENLARQYIEQGHFIRASVAVGHTEAAQAAVDAMVKLLAGSTITENILTAPGDLVTRESLLVDSD